jgi:N-acetylglucosamine PTS system EIICBA or EIICB component
VKFSLQSFQPLGRALMLPIAVLPVAGLLLRLGQPDLLNIPFVAAAGAAIFDNLSLLFAIGIAAGFARDGNGAAGLAGIVCYLIATRGAETLLVIPKSVGAGLPKEVADLAIAHFRQAAIDRLSVPIGILSGAIAGGLYNRFSGTKLPEYLAFFGGRRFVPILSGLVGLLLAGLIGTAYAPIAAGMDALSNGVLHSGLIGLFLYGTLNRILIVTGLHHILNNVAWFLIGDFHGATGDLNRFFASDPTAGAFMTGFFPVMMFGLPAACFAMYRQARPERRAEVGGLLLSMALTAFLTGVTEPIEFSFMFLAPLLYAIHTLLTGLSMVIMDLLRVKLGFTFSAGFFDYVLNYGKATRPLLLIPVGAAYFLVYYATFSLVIRRFDLPTPGREDDDGSADDAKEAHAAERGAAFVKALGGGRNLASIDACTTRLRLVVHEQAQVDEKALRSLGAKGLVRPSAQGLQVVLGPVADLVASEMRVAAGPLSAVAPISRQPPEPAPAARVAAGPWLSALGGRENIRSVSANPSRLMLKLIDPSRLDREELAGLGARVIVPLGADAVHILLADAEAVVGGLAI